MDSGYVAAPIVLLIVFSVIGLQPVTGLTLCDNNDRSRETFRRNSFPRSDICHGNHKCHKGGKKCSFAKLSCQSGYSIYNPVVQGLHTSSEADTCTGLTSHMMIGTSECYWNNMCTVAYPEVPVIVKSLNGDESCLGKCIQSVHVRSWQCVKNTMIHKMCDKTRAFEINIANEVSRQGVIRSHESWPYLYNAETSDGVECNKTFYPHLIGVPGGFTRLALSVDFMDIRPEFETLLAVSDGKRVTFRSNETPKVHVFPDAQTVVLSLRKFGSYKNDETPVGSAGFVICFKFVQRGENPSREDVCRKVFRNNRKDAKCVKCKYRRRGKLIRSYCGKDKEGVRVYNATLTKTKQIKDGCRPWTMRERPCRKKKNPGTGGSSGTRKHPKKKGGSKGKRRDRFRG